MSPGSLFVWSVAKCPGRPSRVAKEWVREAELIPITHLSLDLDETIDGWELGLLQRGVEIVDVFWGSKPTLRLR